MRKIKFLLFGLGLLAISSACEDDLDILPEDEVVIESAFANRALALGVLEGMYSLAQQDNVLNGTSQFIGEWQSDNVDFVGTFPTFNRIRLYTTLSTNGSLFSVWDDHYETIGQANLVIDNFPLVEDPLFTDEDRSRGIAEALFMRALCYLRLSNYFGQPLQANSGNSNLSVPLVLNSEIGGNPPRATLGEVLAQIEADLLAAIPNLVDNSRIRANQGAAQAILARLYLQQERFAEAATMANTVINNSFFQLAGDYTFYNQRGNAEHIFTLPNNADDGQTSFQGFSGLSNPAPNGRGDTPFSDNLLAAFAEEPGDLRFTSLIQMGPDANGAIRTFTSKFPNFQNIDDDAPVIRITEMYLTRAEGNFRAGTAVGDTPLNDINILRNRAGLADLPSVNLDEILNERRKELCFEGFRRMDLLRNSQALRRPGQPDEVMAAFGADRTIFPIPQSEVDLSDGVLQQNPGY